MTIEQFTLPVRLTRGGGLKFLVPIFLSSFLLASGAVLFTFPSALSQMDAAARQSIIISSIAGMATILLFVGAITVIRLKPAIVEISRTGVTLTPMPIVGFSSGTEISHSITNFVSVDLATQKIKGAVVHQIFLRGKESTNDILLDMPKDVVPQEFIQKLATAINLKANV